MIAIVMLALLGFALGYALGVAAKRFKVESDPLVEEINSLLPGTNCGQCGFAGCPAAAEKLVKGECTVDFCPPGGKALAEALANKLGVEFDASKMADDAPQLARVNEALCIGCVKCFRECPTDAIVGAPKQIHAVMWSACTGCGKCIDVCPTMCLEMFVPKTGLAQWRWPKPVESVAKAA